MGTPAETFVPGRCRARHRLTLLAACAVALSLLLSGAIPAHAVDLPFFTMDGSQESILSAMALHPSTVRVGNKVYVAYQGPGYDPYVASYDETTRTWHAPVRVGTNPLRLDAHGAPALVVDSAGFIHVFFGCHFMPLQHSVSAVPGSIDAWRQLPPISSDGTYPQPIKLSDGTLLIFFRQGGVDLYAWAMRISHDNGLTWDYGELPVLAGENGGGSPSNYANFSLGSGDIVNVAFTRMDPSRSPTWAQRRNVYYAWRDTDGIWYDIKGRSVILPVTPQTADAQLRVFDSGPDGVNEVVVKEEPTSVQPERRVPEAVTATTPGAPLIQFITGAGRGAGTYHWEFARWGGSFWTTSTITSTDHNFDSATFDPHSNGTIDSYLVTGDSERLTTRNDPIEGRGGRIEQWASSDHGATWAFKRVVSMDETGTLFGDPQLVPGPSSSATLMFTEWDNNATSFFHRLYLWGPSAYATRPYASRLDRVAGSDRVGTAVAVSHAAFAEGADWVVLATAANFPDALSAGPLAAALKGPVLLVPGSGVPSAVAGEIGRLGAKHAIIIGSTGVIAGRVAADLARVGVKDVQRLAGPDRYATSLAVAKRVGQILGPLGTAVVVSGANFPDALSAGPLAAYNGFPIVLARGDTVPASMTAAFASLGVTSTIIAGSGSVVSTSFGDGLPSPTRLGGRDRYQTSAALALYALDHGLLPYRVMIASGTRFPDGLAGAVLGGQARAALVLASPSGLPTPTAGVLTGLAGKNVEAWVLGGPPAVAASTADAAASILGATVMR